MATLNWKTPNGTTGSIDMNTIVTTDTDQEINSIKTFKSLITFDRTTDDNEKGRIQLESNNGYLGLYGSTSYTEGATITLHGKNSAQSQYAGGFIISTNDGTNSTALVGYPNGILKWNTSNVLTKSNISTGSTDGTISVDGTNVAVKGLASAAYNNWDNAVHTSGAQTIGGAKTFSDNVTINADLKPMYGITMTGRLKGTSDETDNFIITTLSNTGMLYLTSNGVTNSTEKSGHIKLFGSAYGGGYNGAFEINAYDKKLRGNTDGTLTWCGKNVICQKNLSGGGSGYIVFSNTLAFVWGIANFDGAKYVNCTLPISMTHVYKAYGTDYVGDSSTQLTTANGTIAWAAANNTTSKGLITKIRFVSDVTNIAVFQYFVIGNITT